MTYEKPNTTLKSSSNSLSSKSKSSKKESKASRIRKLAAAGHKPREIAAMTGFRLQTVHTAMYYERLRTAKKAISPIKMGRPKGSKDKAPRKSAKTSKIPAAQSKVQFAEVKREGAPLPGSLVYISNPRPNLWTRIKAVFTGRYE